MLKCVSTPKSLNCLIYYFVIFLSSHTAPLGVSLNKTWKWKERREKMLLLKSVCSNNLRAHSKQNAKLCTMYERSRPYVTHMSMCVVQCACVCADERENKNGMGELKRVHKFDKHLLRQMHCLCLYTRKIIIICYFPINVLLATHIKLLRLK